MFGDKVIYDKVRVTPESMGIVGVVLDLFGLDNIDSGAWGTPIYVKNISEEELKVARELVSQQYSDHPIKFTPVESFIQEGIFKISKSFNNQPCIKVNDISPEQKAYLQMAVLDNDVNSAFYKAKKGLSPSLEVEGENGKNIIVEFWGNYDLAHSYVKFLNDNYERTIVEWKNNPKGDEVF